MIALLFRPLWLPSVYTYLDVSKPAYRADVIIVLGGSHGRRETYGIDLYKQEYAPHMLVSGHFDSMGVVLSIIEQSGIPDAALTINDQATSTHDEARQALPILRALNARSALIVTDRFHTRRALATFQQAFQGQDIEFTMVSPDDDIDPSTWWKSGYRNQIELEYLKMVYYLFRFGIWSL